jgi:signal transduction histidine kinase
MAPGPNEPAIDAKWPKLLSLTVHEFRSPVTVVAGYLRMLLKERVGPISEQQRHLLEEAEKSCARLSELLVEVSELSQLEAGTATFNRVSVDPRTIVTDVIASLPSLRDRAVTVQLDAKGTASVHGDATRLKTALAAVITALRREVVSSDALKVHVEDSVCNGSPAVRITVGEAERIPRLLNLAPNELGAFDEWRGGIGLSLVNARRIIEAHGGTLTAPLDDGHGVAVVSLPSIH